MLGSLFSAQIEARLYGDLASKPCVGNSIIAWPGSTPLCSFIYSPSNYPGRCSCRYLQYTKETKIWWGGDRVKNKHSTIIKFILSVLGKCCIEERATAR